METRRFPQPVHPRDETEPAPEDLELLRAFLSLHDHEPGNADSLAPDTDSLRWWLETAGQLSPADRVTDEDLRWALEVRAALVQKVRENMDEPRDADAIELLNRAAERTGLRPCFGCPDDRPIHVDEGGVVGAVGALLGAAFLAELDGRWDRFRLCGDPTCSTVFYDRSRNRSGKWCSMSTCGNRAKVRAFRERQAAG
jgi:predicted RNA-binding Zn ribbon-like protein